ncbi:MAG: hypothetical protein Q8K79_14480 [Solirubrobacteraceae bacterium]|nr:hypothetical protein [Solirubrobacteraceae bacterium]
MRVRIKQGTVAQIRRQPGGFAIQAGSPSDVSKATDALRRAAGVISALDGGPLPDLGLEHNHPKWVSDVVVLPGGPMLMIDGGFMPPRVLSTIPEIVVSKLERAGVSAEVRVPQQAWDRNEFVRVPRAISLRVFAAPPRRRDASVEMPDGWMAEAARWVGATARTVSPVMCGVQGMNFLAETQDVAGLLTQWDRDRPGDVVVATGAMTEVVRAASLRLPPAGNINLALTAGGPGASDDDRVALSADLIDVARRLSSQAAYAFISIEPTLPVEASVEPDWRREMGGAHAELARELCDEIVFDAFPYQLLSSGHLRRLGGMPEGASRLDDDHVEVTVGDISDWLFVPEPEREARLVVLYDLKRRNPDIQRRGRQLLAPCLLSAADARDIYQHRLTQRLQP